MNVSIEQLNTEHEVLTMESSLLSPLDLVQRLPVFVNNVSNFVKGIFTSEIKGAMEYKPNRKTMELLQKGVFANYAEVVVQKPVGLVVNYGEYIESLQASDAVVASLISRSLLPYRNWIGNLINNPADLVSLRNTRIVGDIRIHEREKAAAILSKSFNMQKQSGTTAFGSLCPQAKTWPAITEGVVALDKTLGIVSRSTIEREINIISTQLQSLITMIENDKQNGGKGITPNNAKVLSDVTYAIAKECEFYAAHYYRVMTLIASIRQAEDTLLQVTE